MLQLQRLWPGWKHKLQRMWGIRLEVDELTCGAMPIAAVGKHPTRGPRQCCNPGALLPARAAQSRTRSLKIPCPQLIAVHLRDFDVLTVFVLLPDLSQLEVNGVTTQRALAAILASASRHVMRRAKGAGRLEVSRHGRSVCEVCDRSFGGGRGSDRVGPGR